MIYKGMEVYSWSMIAKYLSCNAAYDYRYNQMLTHEGKSKNMSFGSTVHDGIATWYKTKDLGQVAASMEKIGMELELAATIEEDPKHSIERARNVMVKYVDRYKDTDVRPIAVEMPFLVEVDADPAPFLFAGTMDGLCELDSEDNEPLLYILEHKTTSRMDTNYIKSYHPNNQITAYWWALTKYIDRPVYGAIINIVHMLTNETNFIRHTTKRKPWELERWENDLRWIVANIRRNKEQGVWPLNTTQCTNYGLCSFHTLCNTDPGNKAKFIEAEYKQDIPGDLRWLVEQEKEHLDA